MDVMNRITRGSIVIFSVLLVASFFLPLAAADWPMFHSDAMHTGVQKDDRFVNNTLDWMSSVGSQLWSSPVISGNSLYIGSSNGSLYSLNATDGSIRWSFVTGGEIRSTPAVADGSIFFGSMDDKIYAVNSTSGTSVWSFTTGNYVDSSPLVKNGIVYVGSLDNKLYALNESTGSLLWSYATGSAVVASPVLSGGTIYCGSMDDRMYALNATSGSLQWSHATSGGLYGSPAIDNGVVFIGSRDNSMYALNASSGTVLWSFPTTDYIDSCPATFNGAIFFGCRNGDLYALSETDGAELWNYSTGYSVGSSPAIVNGVVYFGSSNHAVYALNASTGAKLWDYITGGVLVSSPAVSDGHLYIGCWDGNVYALGGEVPAPANSTAIWVADPAHAAAAVAATTVVVGSVAYVFSLASDPLGETGGVIGERTKDLLPERFKEWLEEMVSSRYEEEAEEKKGSLFRPTGKELFAYGVTVLMLAISFAYVKVGSLRLIWTLLPIFLATSILVGVTQKYVAIAYMRSKEVWCEHRIWPLGLVMFIGTTFIFKVPFSTPSRKVHQTPRFTEKLGATVSVLEIFIGLAFAGMFYLLIQFGHPTVGGAGLAMCVIGALSGTLPISPMSGKDVFTYSKKLWAGLFLMTVLVFVAWLLMPATT